MFTAILFIYVILSELAASTDAFMGCFPSDLSLRQHLSFSHLQATDPLMASFEELEFSESQRSEIFRQLREYSLIEADNSSQMLLTMAKDLSKGAIGDMLQELGLTPLTAHQVRAAIVHCLDEKGNPKKKKKVGARGALKGNATVGDQWRSSDYSQVVVSEAARKRRREVEHEYGLPKNFTGSYPVLAQELDEFWDFMTLPSTKAQDPPIRPATAKVYMKHARLFLGWYRNQQASKNLSQVSLVDIIPTPDKESAAIFLEFVIWLRSTRSIAPSYESNILRGLAKLVKFRFVEESQADPTYGEKPYNDIPAVRELRRWHRAASQMQRTAPRVSDESKKWLSWPEYLSVVDWAGKQALSGIQKYDGPHPGTLREYTREHRRIASSLQLYLILAIFACVPDRQRTIRELELDRTFIFDGEVWGIKHTANDYKTGDTYGNRPVLQLPSLTATIDDFLDRWRPCLTPQTKHLFCQPRTGRPMTADSLYALVVTACFRATGQRTNPHLLRDMIVTHVRGDTDASEGQLESLALFMGHSIATQRSSYDRRTLSRKVAPAVELLQSINDNK